MTREARPHSPPSVAVAALLLLASRPAYALDGPGDTQALPCRPTIACTADIVTPGALEIEAGVIYRRLAGDEKQLSDPFLVKLTVAKWLQLQVGSNGFTSEQGPTAAQYFDGVTLGAKFHLVDQSKWVPSLSASFAASVPSASHAGVVEYDDLLVIGYVSKDIGPLHADFNAGANRLAINAYPVTQPWVALALSTSLPRGFGLMIENYYFAPADPFASRDAGGLAAVSYNPISWLVFDAGADLGYVTETRSFSLFAGMTIVPLRLW